MPYSAGTGPEVDPVNDDLRAGRATGGVVLQAEIYIHSFEMVHFTMSTAIIFQTAEVSVTTHTFKQSCRDSHFHGCVLSSFIRKLFFISDKIYLCPDSA